EFTWSDVMSWERDPLWTKARLYFERAFELDREDPRFGLWCSFGLELLARAALASISPTLLAEPEKSQRFLLYALNRATSETVPKSIGAVQVFILCNQLFGSFSKEEFLIASALVNRRNDELHSGSNAFEHYPARQWLAGLYRACRSLTHEMGE